MKLTAKDIRTDPSALQHRKTQSRALFTCAWCQVRPQYPQSVLHRPSMSCKFEHTQNSWVLLLRHCRKGTPQNKHVLLTRLLSWMQATAGQTLKPAQIEGFQSHAWYESLSVASGERYVGPRWLVHTQDLYSWQTRGAACTLAKGTQRGWSLTLSTRYFAAYRLQDNLKSHSISYCVCAGHKLHRMSQTESQVHPEIGASWRVRCVLT